MKESRGRTWAPPGSPVDLHSSQGAHTALAQFPHVHKSALKRHSLEPLRWRPRAPADLREESAGHKVLVLQERDALAAVELLGQIRHVRLQLGKAWWQERCGEWISNPFPSWESRGPWSCTVPTPYLCGFPLGSETPSPPSAAGSSASSAQRGGSWCRRQTGLRASERGSGLESPLESLCGHLLGAGPGGRGPASAPPPRGQVWPGGPGLPSPVG